MEKIAIIDDYYRLRYRFFKWRYSLSIANKILFAIGIACLTGFMAQIKFSLPWTPVPVTGQTFAVLLAGIFLGNWWGGISQIIYLVMGVAGIPWFSNMSGGFNILIGPTGGYLIGFILAAFFLGYFSDKYIMTRNFLPMFGLMLFANFFLIYIPGLLQLSIWFYIVKGSGLSLMKLLWIGAIPFIIGDITKIVTAAALTKLITPKESYNDEIDLKKANKWQIF